VLYPLGRYDPQAPYARDPAHRGEYTSAGRVKKGLVRGDRIEWVEDHDPGFTPDYCNLVRDSQGHFWIFTRQNNRGVAYRAPRPDAIDAWGDEQICIPVEGRHAMDAAALEGGKVYAASVLTTGAQLFGNLYDGEHWGEEPALLADDMTTIAGDDRRLSLEFDPSDQRLHLLYVDASSTLRHRSCEAPYGPANWSPALSEPGFELASGVFTSALSLDSSTKPYGLVVTYGLERYADTDERFHTGKLFARRFDGKQWAGEPVLVSEPGTIHNWYPNVSQDARDGLCVLYSKCEDPEYVRIPLSILATVVPLEALG
jgi:hypothetical protein